MKGHSVHPGAQMVLSSSADTVCTNADEYYAVSGTFSNGGADHFSLSESTLTYTGDIAYKALFVGAAYLEANKVCKCEMAMYVNGVYAFSGPLDFEHANAIVSMSFPGRFIVNPNDTFKIYIKSNTASTTFTLSQLVCVFN